jgi:DNA polymerase III alpha subunit
MIRSATGNDIIAGIEYESLEKLGVVKLDILGTAVLDKIHRVSDILKQPRKRYTH